MMFLPRLIFLVTLLIFPGFSNEEEEEKLYLYEGELERKDYNPVQDLLVSPIGNKISRETDSEDTEDGDKKKSIVTPQILTDQEKKNRVVEFYAPWCPHCQDFRYHYIDFARNCSSLAKTYGMDVDFHAVSCTAHKKVCKKEKINRYPTIRLYPAESANYTEVKFFEIHCFTALRAFGLELDYEEDDSKSNKETTTIQNNHVAIMKTNKNNLRKQGRRISQQESSRTNGVISKYRRDGRTKSQISNDAFLSFDFAMRQSVYTEEGPLKNSTKLVFVEWIGLLKQALPPFWKIHNALDSIASNIENVITDEDALIEIMDRDGPSHQLNWNGCTNDDSHGYTCGLWELFHILTVSVVEWNVAAVTPRSVIPVEQVANLLSSYISEFFACEVCRRHFLSNFDACSQDRCHRLGNSDWSEKEWKQLPLWLWEEHNDVNIRLKREKKEREQGGGNVRLTSEETWDAKWPSRYDCPSCWNSDGTWDDEIIYKYLRLKYWPMDDAKNTQYAKEIQQAAHLTQSRFDDDYGDEGELEEEGIDEEMDFRILVGIPALGLITLVVATIRKQIQLDRTGRHKKMDL
mmetsp:Transcript_29125/g.44454  ORF Transcript_29125/g.44454 Transcript_29125/m.44454 type:complete len:575 (+) Transcript_29125:145-1869(+)